MKPKRTTTKAKPEKPAIPPPPTGWEIVSKDDPRLDYLPVGALFSSKRNPKWRPSLLPVGLPVGEATRNNFVYALPIATQPAAEPAPPMIRLRLPSEKPTKEDGDANGDIILFESHGRFAYDPWYSSFSEDVIAWLPGRLPEGLLPKPPTQEDLWRKEFEERMAELYGMERRDGNPDVYSSHYTQAAWDGFLAAKKGGPQP